MIVLKFGGSSLANKGRILKVVDIIKSYISKGEKVTIVVSAFGGATDQLIKMSTMAENKNLQFSNELSSFKQRQNEIINAIAHSSFVSDTIEKCGKLNSNLNSLLKGIFLLGEVSGRTRDHILSFGERISSLVISAALNSQEIKAEAIDTRNIIKTNDAFGYAKVNFSASEERIRKIFEANTNQSVFVCTGFIASSSQDHTTTLGRGGSDYTAAILASVLGAKQIDIWSDVDGILTANPKKVKDAFTINKLNYEEAMELSHFGAKVIYPPTIIPALKAGIPIYLKNTFNPDFPGSKISDETIIDKGIVKGISSVNNVCIITIEGPGMIGVPGIAAKTFSAIASRQINISLITQSSSEHSISFTVQNQDAEIAKQALEEAFHTELLSGAIEPIKIEKNHSIVAAIGENMRYQPGVAARTFKALGRNGINVSAIAQGSSERNISIVVRNDDEKKALNALHESLFLSKNKEINLFIIGVGLIGSTLIEQIRNQHKRLLQKSNINVRLIGIANSKFMYFDNDGIDLNNWKDLLAKGEKMVAVSFIQRMDLANKRNSIFIDNTATSAISNLYAQILEKSISISTPNKIASSSSYKTYKQLNEIAEKRSVYYNFETNVAAGLPVITTLEDLINSGDEIIKIEAVLSGSLSYIFNNFQGKNSFFDVVNKAKELGLTEPDPRDDLSGSDVKRKVTILGRVIGFELEPDDIKIENFIPDHIMAAPSVEHFMGLLQKENQYFENIKVKAGGNKIRMLAKIDKSESTIKLSNVDEKNPFYNLSGSDNMIVIYTNRYHDQPLVIKGPGAGAEVTAAGVFSEIIRIANQLDH